MKSCALVMLLAILCGAAVYRAARPRVYPPGVLVSDEPVQTELPAPRSPEELAAPLFKGEWTLRPLARFSVTARVLSVRDYRVGSDEMAEICPRDLAVGWGPLSDQAVLDRMRISQAGRFFFFEYQHPPPLPKEQIICHATNLHPIAANDEVARRLARVRAGDLIRLRGPLVECARAGLPRPLRSSLRRDDTGPGACEIVWVEEFETLDAPVAAR